MPADIFARYHRLKGNDVLMVSGTDDHGTPTMIAADREDVTPAALSERYFLTAAGPETQDTDFTWSEFVRRNNDELVATWGNLANRTLQMAHRHFGSVPEPGILLEVDRSLIADVERSFSSVGANIERAKFKAAINEAMATADRVNQYFSQQTPWKAITEDQDRARTIIYVSLRCVDDLKTIMTPFLPFSSQKLHRMLGYPGTLAGTPQIKHRSENGHGHLVLSADYSGWEGRWEPGGLPPGQRLEVPAPMFRKLDDSIVEDEIALMDSQTVRGNS